RVLEAAPEVGPARPPAARVVEPELCLSRPALRGPRVDRAPGERVVHAALAPVGEQRDAVLAHGQAYVGRVTRDRLRRGCRRRGGHDCGNDGETDDQSAMHEETPW